MATIPRYHKSDREKFRVQGLSTYAKMRKRRAVDASLDKEFDKTKKARNT